MSDSLRNGLIRLALVSMLGCYYVGGLVADHPANQPVSEFAPWDDLHYDLDRRVSELELALANGSDRPLKSEAQLIELIAAELANHDGAPHHTSLNIPQKPAATGSASLALLSHQFPHLYERLRQGIYSSQFSRQQAALAGNSASFALLANYCLANESCCPASCPPEDWQAACFALRNAAAEVNRQCRAGNQTGAAAALRRLEAACAAWHAAASASHEGRL